MSSTPISTSMCLRILPIRTDSGKLTKTQYLMMHLQFIPNFTNYLIDILCNFFSSNKGSTSGLCYNAFRCQVPLVSFNLRSLFLTTLPCFLKQVVSFITFSSHSCLKPAHYQTEAPALQSLCKCPITFHTSLPLLVLRPDLLTSISFKFMQNTLASIKTCTCTFCKTNF